MKNKIKKLEEIRKEENRLRDKIFPTERKIWKLEEDAKKLEKQIEKEISNVPANKKIIEKFEANDEFEQICIDIYRDDSFRDIGEDDGTLHITIGKIRGCFISWQDISKREWDKLARQVMTDLGIPKEEHKKGLRN